MAKELKDSKRVKEAAPQSDAPTMRENIRWISGFVILAVGVFIFCSIISYYFYWSDDMSALLERGNELATPRFSNVCGETGAVVADWLVGGGFGLFAIVLPIIIIVIGWRLFRYKPLRLNHFALSLMLVLVLGSLSLGYLFDTKWSIFGTGLGGDYGLAMTAGLKGLVGNVGTLLIIVAGWMLTGIFINRNFIHAVDSAGEQMADGVTDAARWVWGKVHHRKEDVGVESAPYSENDDESEEDDEVLPTVPPVTPPVMMTVERLHPAEDIADSSEPSAEDVTTEAVDEVEPATDRRNYAEMLAAADSPFIAVPREEQPLSPIDVAEVLGVDDSPAEGPIEEMQADGDGLVVTVEQGTIEQVNEEDILNELYDPMRDLANYEPPMPSLLVDHKSKVEIDEQEIFENKERIRETLLNFGIPIRSMHATVGPTVTLYEIVQEQGVKISKISNLENDIAQSLKALGIRIIAPIPGRGTVGIEVPNQSKQTVSMYSAICSKEFQESRAELPVVIGRTIQNENFTFDLAKMPHLLVAGATGQGKSVGLNAIITSLLYRKHPAELKFVLVDPKMVEFSLYQKLEKHFLAKMESEDEAIITDPKKAVYTLNSLVTEMSNRLELCKSAHAKNIVEYNDKFLHRRLNPEHGHRFLPYIVVVIDEFADLIMTAKEVEAPVMRLAQKARAVGIHLIVATQRPDVRVITGGIKANFPARIAFRVMSMTDSRTILDQPGANQLIGRGDMLMSNGGELTRIQCAFVDTPEVEGIVDFIGRQQGYTSAYSLPDYTPEAGSEPGGAVSFGSEESGAPQKYDPKFAEIAREAVANGVISTSMIQRNFEVGFNRAGRIMLQLERAGIVGPQIGSKPREIKFYDLPSLEAKLQDLGIF
ncbi:MAG: DNA translocase FtsK 4TM domain-containing protein [Alistipes sp.]|nr:DNA translocase FtsK 4TM domain-containing protein [Alistipes sp.]